VKRLGAPRIPVGYSRPLEDEARLGAEKILAAVTASSTGATAMRRRERDNPD